jgi:peroxiredoxin
MPLDPLRPGDSAPHFALPTVNREGQVSLDDYRGNSPVLLALFRGLHCPFCRRHIVQLSTTQEKLKAAGVETVAVVNTPLTRAQLYFKYRPARVLLAADPEAATHRSFRVPAPTVVENESEASLSKGTVTMGQLQALRVNPTGELPEPLNPFAAMEILNKKEGFEPNEADQQIVAAHGTQLTGHFLIDQHGIIRWSYVEASERLEDLGQLPSEEEILRAARSL